MERIKMQCDERAERCSKLLGLDEPKKIDITQQLRDRAVAEGLDPDQAVRDAQQFLREYR